MLKRKYTEKCDIWSCGVILYILLCGYPPFNGDNDKIIVDKVLSGKYEFNQAEWAGISPDAIKFIKKMMEYDPTHRYSAEQALNDPWFKLVLGETSYDKPLTVSTLMNLKQFRVPLKNVLVANFFTGWKKITRCNMGIPCKLSCIKRRKESTLDNFPIIRFKW